MHSIITTSLTFSELVYDVVPIASSYALTGNPLITRGHRGKASLRQRL